MMTVISLQSVRICLQTSFPISSNAFIHLYYLGVLASAYRLSLPLDTALSGNLTSLAISLLLGTARMSDASPLTFTQGFMLGQISFLAIILLFMRYVVFSPADKGDEQGWKRRRQEREQVCIAGQICPTVHAQYHYGQR